MSQIKDDINEDFASSSAASAILRRRDFLANTSAAETALVTRLLGAVQTSSIAPVRPESSSSSNLTTFSQLWDRFNLLGRIHIPTDKVANSDDITTLAAGILSEYALNNVWKIRENGSAASSSASIAPPITETTAVTRYGAKAGEFLAQLRRAFRFEPIEDGYLHRADEIFTEALSSEPREAPLWIRAAYDTTQQRQPALAASILRSVGRLQEDEAGEWGQSIAIEALSHSSSEVRESAIRAFEQWEDEQAQEILRYRLGLEDAAWLQEYLQSVIDSLEQESVLTGSEDR